eukprot:PRCOL_00003128-RA
MARVKLYRLSETGQWDDRGTGHVSMEYLEKSNGLGLVVLSEEAHGSVLLVHKIYADDIYQKQGADTIIMWADPELKTDLALSFQEAEGCNYIWRQQHAAHAPGRGRERGGFDMGRAAARPIAKLPPPDVAHLAELAALVQDATPAQQDQITRLVLAPDSTFLGALMDTFAQAEDLEDTESLHNLFRVVRALIMLNEGSLIEMLVGDDLVESTLGALEYDPETPGSRIKHRHFLQKQATFKQVVPIGNDQVVSKIHQTFRVGYLKDVVLARVLDDAVYSTLGSIMLCNYVEILTAFQQDSDVLPAVFDKLKSLPPTSPEWMDLLLFLQEVCTQAKHLHVQQRASFYNTLVRLGLLDIITTSLQAVRLAGADVFMYVLMQDANMLRTFLADQPGHELFSLLIDELASAEDSGVQAQVLDAMRVLLDPETMDQPTDKNNFLDLFYDRYVGPLVDAAVWPNGEGAADGDAPVCAARAMMLGSVLDLLCFCVYAHTFRIKYYILRNNVVEKILQLLRRREAPLVLGALRFLRTCLGRRDPFYYRYLIKNDLFNEVVAVFSRNGKRYNVLNSAVIEMVNFIIMNGCTSLVRHLVERHWDALAEHDYVPTFKALRQKYEQIVANDNCVGGDNAMAGDEGVGGQQPHQAYAGAGGAFLGDGGDGGPDGVGARGGPPGGLVPMDGEKGPLMGMPGLRAMQPVVREARAMDRSEEVYFGESGGDANDDGGGGGSPAADAAGADDGDEGAAEFLELPSLRPLNAEDDEGFIVGGNVRPPTPSGPPPSGGGGGSGAAAAAEAGGVANGGGGGGMRITFSVGAPAKRQRTSSS